MQRHTLAALMRNHRRSVDVWYFGAGVTLTWVPLRRRRRKQTAPMCVERSADGWRRLIKKKRLPKVVCLIGPNKKSN